MCKYCFARAAIEISCLEPKRRAVSERVTSPCHEKSNDYLYR